MTQAKTDEAAPVKRNVLRSLLAAYAAYKRFARSADRIRASEYFDSDWYHKAYPETAGKDAVAHYLKRGYSKGYDPSPFFSSNWYLASYPDVATTGLNPLLHYLDYGAAEGRAPNRDFDVAARSGMFDAGWYLEQYADVVNQDPLLHFMSVGHKEGRNPSPMFDVIWYLESNPDAAKSGMNPLLHYLNYGEAEGRVPTFYFDILVRSGLFDRAWYRENYPDAGHRDPLLHFMTVGYKDGRRPSPTFDASWYLATYDDVVQSGVNPLLHFVQKGLAEGHFISADHELVATSGLFDATWYLSKYRDAPAEGPLLHFAAVGLKEGRAPNRDFDVVARSGMFDAGWYLAQCPDVINQDPLLHFMRVGHREGHNPSAIFDVTWYLERYPDVASSGMNPLLHYLEYGASEGRVPSPYFDILVRAGLFDSAWYREKYSDAGGDALLHFMTVGYKEGRRPSPAFDSSWYLATYGDVAQSGANPLLHFVQRGLAEGRFASPDHQLIATSGLFDIAWYIERYPDVSHQTPLLHFMTIGAKEGRSPSALFDTAWYLAVNSDIAASEVNPLAHYLRFGTAEGRNPNPLFDVAWYLASSPDVRATGMDPLAHYLQYGAADGRSPNPLFDDTWYVAEYLDVAASGMNPLAHYLQYGAADGRKPNPLFDTSWYLATYPDVAATGQNPLEHYLRTGAFEGRKPNPFFDSAWYLAAYPHVEQSGENPLAHYLREGAYEGLNPNPVFDGAWYLGSNPDVEARRDNPLLHYLQFGAAEGRAPNPLLVEADAINAETLARGIARWPALPLSLRQHAEHVERVMMFDARFYRERCSQDLKGLPPLLHFLLLGEAEGARPYAEYTPEKMRATLLARGISSDRHSFLSFVHSQTSNFQAEIERDRAAGRPTWVSPLLVRFTVAGAEGPRALKLSSAPLDHPALRWSVGPSTKSDFAIPIIGPDAEAESVVIGIEGTGTAQSTYELTLFENLDAPPVTTLIGRYEFKLLGARWNLEGVHLEPGRRYFLQVSSEQAAGAEIVARAFHSASWVEETEPALTHVAIITIVFRKSSHIEPFLEAIFRQDYAGPISVVIVDDGSPEDAIAELEDHIASVEGHKPNNVAIEILRNGKNLGNCLSRNVAIQSCDADVYVVIDSDCLINESFVSSHVAEHRLPGTDAVVGPYNIETHGEDGLRMVRRLERDANEVIARSAIQDELAGNAFVNTVTRNFSIKKSWLDQHGHFDPELSYSKRPDTGYGWEDVEIGARIYAAKGTLRYTPHAFSVHMTHESSQLPAVQVRGSAKNFRYLANKHPFMKTVARRWYTDTADRIVMAADNLGLASPDVEALRSDTRDSKRALQPLLPYLRKQKPKYRILTHRWHVPHQYEIYKLPFEFTLLTGIGPHFTNEWGSEQRPMRHNVRMVPADSVRPSDFDLAIIHFDENVLCPDLSNGVLGNDWGNAFRWMIENIKLPTVAVCHGTVPFVGQYAANPEAISDFELYQSDADKLRATLADTKVVLNSHQAAAEWQFRRSRVIWQGFDPQEFNDGTHDLDVIHHGIDMHRPHYRGAHALRTALALLEAEGDLKISSHKHAPSDAVPRSDPRYADFSFAAWVKHVGRHKAYLNTTLRSPMPRARGEAMLSGVVPVTLDNHDVSLFIENGVNGFYSSSVEELADFCRSLCRNAPMRQKMSAAARATAIDVFNHDRFLTQWIELVEEMLR